MNYSFLFQVIFVYNFYLLVCFCSIVILQNFFGKTKKQPPFYIDWDKFADKTQEKKKKRKNKNKMKTNKNKDVFQTRNTKES